MLPIDALKHLGVDEVIWIDDVFNTKEMDLAALLAQSLKAAAECDFPELQSVFAKADFSGDDLIEEISEALAQLSPERRAEITAEFLAKESIREHFPTPEVSNKEIDDICVALGIGTKNRWTFKEANAQIDNLVKNGDSNVAFIVDLNDDAGGQDTQGLEILKLLHSKKSQSTAFIFTHAATAEDEAKKEAELRQLVAGEQSLYMPICVIAKKRTENKSKEQLDQELLVSIKRASLRKSMSEVLSAGVSVVDEAFRKTAEGLLSIPPEQLEEYVYERGHIEGVSELHVVERIVTSQIGKKLQQFFGTDSRALASASRLRKVRAIELGRSNGNPDQTLVQYRYDEVFESAELINSSYSPIACGDVFAVDDHEKDVKKISAMFVLLAQPCDIALRPEKAFRGKENALLVPLKKMDQEDDPNSSGILPCELHGFKWRCNFDNATQANVRILDLASFRTDGRVKFEEGQEKPTDLLPSHERIYDDRVRNPNKILIGQIPVDTQGCAQHPSLQLSFGFENEFSHFYVGRVKEAKPANPSAKIPELFKRVTWRLRRIGRIRAPHSIDFLEEYLRDMGRRAFDRDFVASK